MCRKPTDPRGVGSHLDRNARRCASREVPLEGLGIGGNTSLLASCSTFLWVDCFLGKNYHLGHWRIKLATEFLAVSFPVSFMVLSCSSHQTVLAKSSEV